jgi:hypothetical protein
MPIRVNFEGVSTDNTFAPWDINTPIEFTIFNITVREGKDSGKPYLEFEFKHSDSNRKAWRNYSLQPNALWALKQLLVDLGTDPEDLEGEFDFEPNDVLGSRVNLFFGQEREYNGRKTQDVDRVVAAD